MHTDRHTYKCKREINNQINKSACVKVYVYAYVRMYIYIYIYTYRCNILHCSQRVQSTKIVECMASISGIVMIRYFPPQQHLGPFRIVGTRLYQLSSPELETLDLKSPKPHLLLLPYSSKGPRYCYGGDTFPNHRNTSYYRNPTFYYKATVDPLGSSSPVQFLLVLHILVKIATL